MKYVESRPTCVFDIETYQNYFLVKFRCVDTFRGSTFEMYENHDLDRDRLLGLLRRWRIISFNGNSYDIPIMSLALSGADNITLKRASDDIIMANLRPWEFYEKYGVSPPDFLDHIDLIELPKGRASLKLYGGRLHSKKLQDLPIEPDVLIDARGRVQLVTYCDNDLQTTIDLVNDLRPQITLREQMSEQYGVDLRSRSDAQIAEVVIKQALEKLTRRRVYRPDVKPGTFAYRAPESISFRTELMQSVFQTVRRARFVVRRDGRVEMPEELANMVVRIGDSAYRMGIGGLHSSETSVSHYADDEHELIDADVGSYYPSMIIVNKFVPRAMGTNFLKIYSDIYTRRMEAKHNGDKVTSDVLKITLNGTFGKLGSPYSIMYSPDLMIQVTVTGQLLLLMLIERLESYGIHVVSANTDGIVSKVPRNKRHIYEAVLFDWECETGLELEMNHYRSLHSRDVNNYIAITDSGKVKCKGAFAPATIDKNPNAEVAVMAVIEYLTNGTPIEDTIERCADITKFIMIRQVRGGACVDSGTLPHLDYLGLSDSELDEVLANDCPIFLGRVVRWYYAKGVRGGIHYKLNGNTVPRTEGAMPCMELPDELPDDIDYGWYIREAYGILKDIGAVYKDPSLAGRSGEIYGRLPDRKTVHIVELPEGVALCGVSNAGPRAPWIEFDDIPEGLRLCPKCRRAGEL